MPNGTMIYNVLLFDPENWQWERAMSSASPSIAQTAVDSAKATGLPVLLRQSGESISQRDATVVSANKFFSTYKAVERKIGTNELHEFWITGASIEQIQECAEQSRKWQDSEILAFDRYQRLKLQNSRQGVWLVK